MTEFDWAGVMRAGIGGLRLLPRDFWGLTPAELMLMLGVGPTAARIDRARLEQMVREFPDLAKGANHDSK